MEGYCRDKMIGDSKIVEDGTGLNRTGKLMLDHLAVSDIEQTRLPLHHCAINSSNNYYNPIPEPTGRGSLKHRLPTAQRKLVITQSQLET